MRRKNTFIVGILVLVILLSLIFYFYNFNDNTSSEKSNGSMSGNSREGAEIQPKIKDSFVFLESLDKEDCKKAEPSERENCFKYIDLVNQAISKNDSSLCFEKSINISSKYRNYCYKRSLGVKV